MMNNTTLWLIPARSGSKGILNKNIKDLNGFPLISYRIKTATSISNPEHVWVSTDSAEYAEIAKSYGANVPFLRPESLASDNASSMDVVLHAMNYATEIGKKYGFIGLLEPTSPFVFAQDISNAVEMLRDDHEAKAIVAVRESRPNSIFIQEDNKYLDKIGGRIRAISSLGRQAFNREITPSGGFYIAKWDEFLKEKNFYTDKTLSYLLGDASSLEIDELIDWQWAEYLLDRKIIDVHKLFNLK